MSLMDNPKAILEGALLTSQTPLSLQNLRQCLSKRYSRIETRAMLIELQEQWKDRALELKEVGEGLWQFQSVPQMRDILQQLHPEETPKYTRTVMETLAVIAYRQPVTRGDIERIRGVTVNANAIKTLLDRNWIEVIGRREVVGHPELFATTRQFLLDLGLNSLEELPSIGPKEEPMEQDFELFKGQSASLPLQPASANEYLNTIDAEHAKLEKMTLPLLQATEEHPINSEDIASSLSFEENIDERNSR